jgi:hypothetical protein
VDEVHMLGDPGRGPVLEALLARVRDGGPKTRIVGLSATVAHAEQLADWLRARLLRVNWRPSRLIWQLPAIANVAGVRPDNLERFAGGDPWTSMYGGPLRLADDARRFDLSPAWHAWVGAAPGVRLLTQVGTRALYTHALGLFRGWRRAAKSQHRPAG